MPATPDRIARITRAFLPVVSGPSTTVADAYGNSARDDAQPVETFFETEADTQAMADERLALMGTTRRRFAVGITDPATALGFDYNTQLPTVALIDDDRAIDDDVLVTGLEIDLNTSSASLKVWK